MIAHHLFIGQRIYDTYDGKWGTILLINGKEENARVIEDDEIILYKPDDSDGESETAAWEAYPLVEDKFFWGEEVCTEINRDDFDDDHKFDYFCPERYENCFAFECSD